MSNRYRGTTLEGNAVEVEVDEERIVAVEEIAADGALPLIAPPLVDLQHNKN